MRLLAVCVYVAWDVVLAPPDSAPHDHGWAIDIWKTNCPASWRIDLRYPAKRGVDAD